MAEGVGLRERCACRACRPRSCTPVPSVLAASAAVAARSFPVLFCPSVSRMTILLFASEASRRLDRRRQRRADGGAVLDHADVGALEIVQEQAVIEGERRLRVRAGAANSTRPTRSPGRCSRKSAHHRLHRIQPAGALAVEGEVFRQHAAGDVDRQHDVDAFGVDLRLRLAELRARQRARPAAPARRRAWPAAASASARGRPGPTARTASSAG